MARTQRLPADPAGRAAYRSGRKTGVREGSPNRKTDRGRPTVRHTVRRTSSRRDCRRYTEGTSCRASTERRKLEIAISNLVFSQSGGQHFARAGTQPDFSCKKVNAKARPYDRLPTGARLRAAEINRRRLL